MDPPSSCQFEVNSRGPAKGKEKSRSRGAHGVAEGFRGGDNRDEREIGVNVKELARGAEFSAKRFSNVVGDVPDELVFEGRDFEVKS